MSWGLGCEDRGSGVGDVMVGETVLAMVGSRCVS